MLGAAVELIAKRQLVGRPGDLAEPYKAGTTGAVLRVADFLTAGALAGAVLGGKSRAVSALSGAGRRLGPDPVRDLPGGPGVGPGSQVHHRPATPPSLRGMNWRPPVLPDIVASR